jgi:hypothetical protein
VSYCSYDFVVRQWLAAWAGSLLLCLSAMAQGSDPVTVQLSLAGKSALEGNGARYQIGEPILLELAFTAVTPGFSLNTTTTEPASPIDAVVLAPTAGVFPWLEDQARGNRYVPDYAAMAALEVGKTVTVRLPLNAVYRFDKPGHYAVHVVTTRVALGQARPAALTSNAVSFEVGPMSEPEESRRAALLEKNIREAADLQSARVYAEELDWLTGDASTRMKLSLFLHPKVFYPFAVDVTRGLWVARNRALVVARLEAALDDPAQPFPAGSSFLATTAALKARLMAPFDPGTPTAPPAFGLELENQQIETEYLKRIALSLPKRKGEALVDAARTVFIQLGQRKETSEPGFAEAREVLIAHFGEVNEFNVDWLLDTYGRYFEDARMVPALKQILATQRNASLGGERTAALKQLLKIAPDQSRQDLIDEVCANNPTLLEVFDGVPFETLPETDDCLMRKIASAATGSGRWINLQWAAELAARFSTPAIYDDLLSLYLKSGSTWDKQTQGYVLAYLVRWDAKRGLPLLEGALPVNATAADLNMVFSLDRAYSPALATFWRKRLEIAPPEQARQAAGQLAEHGTAEDQARLRARLERWRSEWSGREIPASEGWLEADLVDVLLQGKNWQTSETEAAGLWESCLSVGCKTRFAGPR